MTPIVASALLAGCLVAAWLVLGTALMRITAGSWRSAAREMAGVTSGVAVVVAMALAVAGLSGL